MAPSSSTGPTWVLNMRWNGRASVRSFDPQFGQVSSIWSARHRSLHLRQSTSGSVNVARWPDASHTLGAMRIAASRPTMSSRSCTMARHQASMTLRLSSTPKGP